MKKKECKHKFKHIVIKSQSMSKTDIKEYEWIVHECIKCHKKAVGGKIE